MQNRKKTSLILSFLILTLSIYYLAVQTVSAQSGVDENSEVPRDENTDFNFSFPVIYVAPTPTPIPPPIGEVPKTLFCSSVNADIPDNNQNGISNTITIPDAKFIRDLDVRIDIDHTWIGDLAIDLTHTETGITIRLIDRPGSAAGSNNEGCGLDNIRAILDDDISLPVEEECSSFPAAVSVNQYIPAAIAGIYLPEQELATFDSESISGNWILTVSDLSPVDKGKLNNWCLSAELIDTPNFPPTPPPPTGLPRNAYISGVTGRSQALPLDCESRSAVDWANFFGTNISELDFFYGLPESDNPDLGFVGSVSYPTGPNQFWGQIPPKPYGVHADPIAKRLRKFGLPAVSHRPLSWNALRAEIANGRPVIVWILGSNYSGYDYVVNGIPEYYRPNSGYNTVVARYEHTVIVMGYTQDSVYYLNGGTIYQKSRKQFLESWSALGNMAVTFQP
ncbi:MAG: C39 family peptidase [Chloroflexota bacterium]|nr:MAG: C39 family peptidase [Chloroflexota bacterium]